MKHTNGVTLRGACPRCGSNVKVTFGRQATFYDPLEGPEIECMGCSQRLTRQEIDVLLTAADEQAQGAADAAADAKYEARRDARAEGRG